MKLHAFFLLTHATTTVAISMLVFATMRTESLAMIAAGSMLSVVTVLAASCYASFRIRTGLSNLESVVADQDSSESLSAGLIEIDLAAHRIASHAERWESVAANNREQARDFQSMMFLLNRRGADRKPSSDQLRGLLAGLGNTLHSHLSQIETGARQVEAETQAIADGAESQGAAVIRTTTYLEQLCSTIDSVSSNIAESESNSQRTGEAAGSAQESIRELTEGLQSARSDSKSCEQKLRGLCDPAQQINGIVETICGIAARTDILALNASIESIRAGEHGKQFAKVADEVRKLAEQSTDATREISSLIETMQLVTQESIHRIVRGREQVESQVAKAGDVDSSLQQICEATELRTTQVQQIKEVSTQQLQLAQNVVLEVEQISEIAKASRGGAESACWTIKAFSKTPPEFESAVSRLRQCGGVMQEISEQRPSTTVAAKPAAAPAAPTATPATNPAAAVPSLLANLVTVE